jgi:hypothetical protein
VLRLLTSNDEDARFFRVYIEELCMVFSFASLLCTFLRQPAGIQPCRINSDMYHQLGFRACIDFNIKPEQAKFSEIYFILVKNENKIIDFLKNTRRFFTVSLVITNLIFIFNKLYDIYIFHLTLYFFNIIQIYILYYRNKIKEKELKVHPVYP